MTGRPLFGAECDSNAATSIKNSANSIIISTNPRNLDAGGKGQINPGDPIFASVECQKPRGNEDNIFYRSGYTTCRSSNKLCFADILVKQVK